MRSFTPYLYSQPYVSSFLFLEELCMTPCSLLKLSFVLLTWSFWLLNFQNRIVLGLFLDCYVLPPLKRGVVMWIALVCTTWVEATKGKMFKKHCVMCHTAAVFTGNTHQDEASLIPDAWVMTRSRGLLLLSVDMWCEQEINFVLC